MEEQDEILLCHRRRYPKMELQDWVKLLYQRTFGPGHLLRDPAAAREFLIREWETVAAGSRCLPENIGGGLVRIHLSGLQRESLEVVWQAFSRTASQPRGSREAFLATLTRLEQLARSGILPDSPEAVREYLGEYARRGYPMVSHSDTYRRLYHPAYRVADKEILRQMEGIYGPL